MVTLAAFASTVKEKNILTGGTVRLTLFWVSCSGGKRPGSILKHNETGRLLLSQLEKIRPKGKQRV